MDPKKLTNLINSLEEKPGGTIRIFGEWFGRPYDNYHKILECIYKDEILDIKFDTSETIRVWNPNHIMFKNNELIIEDSTYVEFLRFDYGKPKSKENVIREIYINGEVSNPDKEYGKVHQNMVKPDYPAFELL
ncbi:hypothetical protein [Oceanobacillus sp. CAU 1775]